MPREAVGILLAAGSSTRFGDNKLIQPLPDSKTSVAVQAALHMRTAVADCIAIVRADDQALIKQLSETGIDIIINNDADSGISSSLRLGIQQRCGAFAWIVALADMPFIPPAIFLQVSHALQHGAMLAAPVYQGQRGHPVGFSSKLREELLQLKGDYGAKSVIDAHRDALHVIQVGNNAVLRDIDRPQHLYSQANDRHNPHF